MEYKLKDLIDIPRMREVFDTFDAINSMPSAIIDIDGNVLIANSWQDICTKFHRVNPESEKKCIESDTHFVVELEKRTPHVIYKCPMGLVDSASPIIIDGKHLGNVFTGQLFLEPPDEAKFIEQARQYGFDEAEYLAAMRKVPLFTEEQLHKNLTFIHTLAVMTTEQALQQKRALEASEQLRKSDERHRSILQTTLDGVWMVDMHGRVLEVNESYARMSGYSVQELLTLHVYDLDVDETPEDTIVHIEAIKQHGTLLFEARHRRKDGSIFDVETNVQYRPEDGGQIVAFIRDVTERKQAEQALRESENEFRFLAEAMPQIVWITRADGWNIYFNQQWMEYTGLTPEESHGHGWNKPFHSDDQQRAWDAWQNAVNNVGTYSLECRLRRADGVYKWWLIRGVPVLDAEGTILKWFGTCTDIDEFKKAEEELGKREATFRAVAELSPMAIYASSGSDQKGVYANEAFFKTFGFSMEDIPTVGLWWIKAFPDEKYRQQVIDQWTYNIVQANKNNTDVEALECVCVCKDGSEKNIAWVGKTIGDEFWAFGYDLTERKQAEVEKSKLEAQLNQAQKLESVGRLAGGVAHDFNNMLTVILGHAQLGLMHLEPTHPVCANLAEISKTAERSADLTRQLLAFARKQTIAPKVLDLNETISGMLKMMQRLIGEDINLNWHPAPNLWPVKMDPSQVDQILANLCVNARDSIANVGKINIETGSSIIDKEYCTQNSGCMVGEYVRLSLSDNGCGMDKATQEQIFEPFFTTKGIGEGTGLGLATVYGIVKQNNGFINVYSEPGLGTTFTIYLPRYVGKAEQVRTEGTVEPAKRGKETILLVEDEPIILNITSMILTKQGYTILAAHTPSEAIRLASENIDKIQILITDVVMPEMNGKDLAEKLQSLYPQLKCLYMSGYTSDVIAHHGVLDEGVYFIQKPYSLLDLASKVRAVLDGT